VGRLLANPGELTRRFTYRSDAHTFNPSPSVLRSYLAVFLLDTRTRLVSNASSGEPDGVPDNEVNAHLGNLCGRALIVVGKDRARPQADGSID
jgi:hypothetical protein